MHFDLEFKEHTLIIQGNILMKKGYIKNIPIQINVFSNTIICVFWNTAPKEDNNIQKNIRKIIPDIKNIIYFIIKFFLTSVAISFAFDKLGCILTCKMFLSDKNISLIII